MVIYGVFLLVFLVSQGFLFLEEEVIILLAAIFWVDCAGGVIKEALWSELEHRRHVVRDKFKWYLELKRDILKQLISKHEGREELIKQVVVLYTGFGKEVMEKLVSSYEEGYKVLSAAEVKKDINLMGSHAVYSVSMEKWGALLSCYLWKKMDGIDSALNKEWLGKEE